MEPTVTVDMSFQPKGCQWCFLSLGYASGFMLIIVNAASLERYLVDDNQHVRTCRRIQIRNTSSKNTIEYN